MTQNLIFRPVVAEKLGTHRLTDPVMGALILEQLNLWHVSGNGFFDTDGNFWLNPSVSDWEQAAGASFSPWKVRAIVGKFEQLGYVIREKFCKLCDRLINSPQNLRSDNHTKLIRLNWERLAKLWEPVEPISNDGSDQISESDSFSFRSDKSESDIKTLEILKSESETESKKLEILKSESQASPLPPLPESPEEEQMQLMAEVRNATGKLSPQLQRLITEVAPDILRAALAKYPRDGSVKKPCSYLMKIIDQIKAERAATPKSASNETTTEAMIQWFQEACRAGVVFHDETDFATLPVVMNQICCRVTIPNRREIDPPYELRPIVELMKSKNLITV
ncbi:hypothetical protein FACHB389_32825 [Nostoc calcicola FACHB-389]|nr:hypothetical protein [Nostoc calcicola FACHB-3891]OKH20373.1 hypothetical protein FACHB389_32825 [Nostoc calcicola FACHB-389]